MLIAALAAAAAVTGAPAPVAARVEARATVRIVRGTPIRFGSESVKDQPPPATRTVRERDGTASLARLVEFE
jgi:hypothetical protein